MLYYPLFMQGIQGISAMKSGQIITPLGFVMAFVGMPVGFLVARTKSYKWMFVLGYALVTLVMFGMIFFDKNTPAYFGFVAAALSGLALGAMPTVNTIVTQAAVPRRLLGVATSALMFSVSMGMATAPAILGSAMNMRYNNALKASLPGAIAQTASDATMTSLGDPRVLLSEPAMRDLRETLTKTGGNGEALFEQTVEAIRTSMESGLRMVFIIAASNDVPGIPADTHHPGDSPRSAGRRQEVPVPDAGSCLRLNLNRIQARHSPQGLDIGVGIAVIALQMKSRRYQTPDPHMFSLALIAEADS